MTQAVDQGERCIVFDDLAELFEAHRASREVLGQSHPVSTHLFKLMEIVWIERCPLDYVADLDAETSALVIDALTNSSTDDPWRQAEQNRMLAGIGRHTLLAA